MLILFNSKLEQSHAFQDIDLLVVSSFLVLVKGNFSCFWLTKLTFLINSLRNTIRVSDSLDPDQDQTVCKRVLADDKSPLAREELRDQV